jgi:hypothetical protein
VSVADDAFPRPNAGARSELGGHAQDAERAVVLGGGYRGADGIFAFKKSLAPKGEVAFRVGKKTYNAALAQRMAEERRSWETKQGNDWIPDPQYFPVYRA